MLFEQGAAKDERDQRIAELEQLGVRVLGFQPDWVRAEADPAVVV